MFLFDLYRLISSASQYRADLDDWNALRCTVLINRLFCSGLDQCHTLSQRPSGLLGQSFPAVVINLDVTGTSVRSALFPLQIEVMIPTTLPRFESHNVCEGCNSKT